LTTIHETGAFTQQLNSAGVCWWSSSESNASRAWYVKSNGSRKNELKNIEFLVREIHDF